jgi:hypothetical protein
MVDFGNTEKQVRDLINGDSDGLPPDQLKARLRNLLVSCLDEITRLRSDTSPTSVKLDAVVANHMDDYRRLVGTYALRLDRRDQAIKKALKVMATGTCNVPEAQTVLRDALEDRD